jgi:hypothetical protein
MSAVFPDDYIYVMEGFSSGSARQKVQPPLEFTDTVAVPP